MPSVKTSLVTPVYEQYASIYLLLLLQAITITITITSTITITITGLSAHFLRIDSNVWIDRWAYVVQPWYAYSWR